MRIRNTGENVSRGKLGSLHIFNKFINFPNNSNNTTMIDLVTATGFGLFQSSFNYECLKYTDINNTKLVL